MRPKTKVKWTPMSAISTPYDGQRRRVHLMERLHAMRAEISAGTARDQVARAVGLSAEQLVNIRKGRLKDLYDSTKGKIDRAFILLVQRQIEDLDHELALAEASTRGVDPGVVAKAKASLHALEQLIDEAEGGGRAARDRTGAGH